MAIRTKLGFLLGCLLFLGCIEAAEPTSWSCRVVEPDGKPIVGAEVFVRKAQTLGSGDSLYWSPRTWQELKSLTPLGTTDSQGRITSTSLKSGAYEVGIRAQGYALRVIPRIWIGIGREDLEEGIVLKKAILARGKVVDDDGNGVEGAAVQLLIHDPFYPGGGPSIRAGAPVVTTSGVHGEFQFAEIEGDRQFSLLAVKSGFDGLPLEWVTLDSLPDGIRLVLRSGGTVQGRVMYQGTPQASATLQLLPSQTVRDGTLRMRWTNTGQDGRFAFRAVAPGPYVVHARPAGTDGKIYESDEFQVERGSTQEIPFEFSSAAVAGSFETVTENPVRKGRVVGPDGQGIAGAKLTLDFDPEPIAISAADGIVDLTDIQKDGLLLFIEKEGYVFRPGFFSAEGRGQSAETVWRLVPAPAAAKGKIKGLSGAESAMAEVKAQEVPFGPIVRGKIENGTFLVQGLTQGTWLLSASLARKGIATHQLVTLEADQRVAELTLDFGRDAQTWTGTLERAGKIARNVQFVVIKPSSGSILMEGFSSAGKIELRLPAGTYKLFLDAGDANEEMLVEIGTTKTQVIDLGEPKW